MSEMTVPELRAIDEAPRSGRTARVSIGVNRSGDHPMRRILPQSLGRTIVLPAMMRVCAPDGPAILVSAR